MWKPLFDALKDASSKSELLPEHEHAAWTVEYRDTDQRHPQAGYDMVTWPEYRRLRAIARRSPNTTSRRSR